MAKITLQQLEGHAPWQVGEIVVVKITTVDGQTYSAETVDTFPADIKEQHAAALKIEQDAHAVTRSAHEFEMQRANGLQDQLKAAKEQVAAIPAPEAPAQLKEGEIAPQPLTDRNRAHQEALAKHLQEQSK